MGPIGNRYLQGQPSLPYTNYKALANTDTFLDMQFVDHTQTPVTPVTVMLEIDDITNCIEMLPPTALTSTGSTAAPLFYPAFSSSVWTLQISALILQMSFPNIGSQLCQLKFSFTAYDSVTNNPFTGTALCVIELVAVASVSGQ